MTNAESSKTNLLQDTLSVPAASARVLPTAAKQYHQHWCQLNVEAFGEPSVDSIGGRTFWLNKLTGALRWQMPPSLGPVQHQRKHYVQHTVDAPQFLLTASTEETRPKEVVKSREDDLQTVVHDQTQMHTGANSQILGRDATPISRSENGLKISNGVQQRSLSVDGQPSSDELCNYSSSSACSSQSYEADGEEEQVLSETESESATSVNHVNDDGGWLGENPHRVTNAGWGQQVHAQGTALEPMPLDGALAYAVAAARAAGRARAVWQPAWAPTGSRHYQQRP